MKEYLLPAALQIMGLLVIIAEIFIPSFGLLSLAAAGLFGYSLFLVFTTIGKTAGLYLVALDLVLVPVLIYVGIQMLAKSNLSLKKELSKDDGVASQDEQLAAYLNMKGEAVTDLRPAGMAMIDSKRMDVVTDGEYIDKGTPVVVTHVTGNQIIVEKII